jgi:hypothetical protein
MRLDEINGHPGRLDIWRDNCPIFPGAGERIHWSFEDPAAVQGSEGERLAAFRRIRDQIHERVKTFLQEKVEGSSLEHSRP